MKRTMPDPGEGFDVVVVGGGPGGSAGAKRFAREGFRTLLLGVLRRLHSLQEHLYHEAGRGARILSKALAAAYRTTLHVGL